MLGNLPTWAGKKMTRWEDRLVEGLESPAAGFQMASQDIWLALGCPNQR